MEKQEVIEHISKELLKGKRINLIFGVFGFAVGVGIFFFNAETDTEVYTKYGFMAFAFLIGISGVFTAYKKDPGRNVLIKALKENPDEIHRIYPVHNVNGKYHTSTTILYLMNSGKVFQILIPKEKEDEWLDALKQIAPNTNFGYIDPFAKEVD